MRLLSSWMRLGGCLLLFMLPCAALAQAPLGTVDVGWNRVPDSTIERCNLGDFQKFILQGLLDSGYSVVPPGAEARFLVEFRVDGEEFELQLRDQNGSVPRHQVERVSIPRVCDRSLSLTLTHRMLEGLRLLREQPVVAGVTSPAQPESSNTLTGQLGVSTAKSPDSKWQSFLSAGGEYHGEGNFVYLAGVRVTRALNGSASLGLRSELGLHPNESIVIVEPRLGVELSVEVWKRGGIFGVIGVGARGHAFRRRGETGWDGHIAPDTTLKVEANIPETAMRVSAGAFGLYRRVEHVIESEIAFRSPRVGVVLNLGWNFGF
ncbi:MAG: hypothetical protein AAFQ82_18300 [Myxococcota bacterium]